MHFFLFMIYLLGMEFHISINSSGDCNFAESLTMEKKCTGKVTENTYKRWRDTYAPVHTHYEIWTAPGDDATMMVTFFKSDLSDKNTIDMKCIVPAQGKCDIKFDKNSHVHCFDYSIAYLEDLRASCLNLKFDLSKTVKKPIIFYTQPLLYRSEVLDLLEMY